MSPGATVRAAGSSNARPSPLDAPAGGGAKAGIGAVAAVAAVTTGQLAEFQTRSGPDATVSFGPASVALSRHPAGELTLIVNSTGWPACGGAAPIPDAATSIVALSPPHAATPLADDPDGVDDGLDGLDGGPEAAGVPAGLDAGDPDALAVIPAVAVAVAVAVPVAPADGVAVTAAVMAGPGGAGVADGSPDPKARTTPTVAAITATTSSTTTSRRRR